MLFNVIFVVVGVIVNTPHDGDAHFEIAIFFAYRSNCEHNVVPHLLHLQHIVVEGGLQQNVMSA